MYLMCVVQPCRLYSRSKVFEIKVMIGRQKWAKVHKCKIRHCSLVINSDVTAETSLEDLKTQHSLVIYREIYHRSASELIQWISRINVRGSSTAKSIVEVPQNWSSEFHASTSVVSSSYFDWLISLTNHIWGLICKGRLGLHCAWSSLKDFNKTSRWRALQRYITYA